MTRRIVLAVAIVALIAPSAARAQNWYEVYDDAISDIDAGRWPEAERKLLQAIKSGVSSGDRVRRYSNIYDHYFPEFFLGIVYLQTNRPKPALEQFQRARAAGIDKARNARFRQIATLEKQAQDRIVLAEAKPSPGPPPPSKPAPPTPTTVPAVPAAPVDPLEGVRKQFNGTLNEARAQFTQRNYARADQLARASRTLAEQNKMTAQRDEANGLISQVNDAASAPLADALRRRDAAAARQEYGRLVAVLPGAAEPFATRLEALEGETKAATTTRNEALALQREAMMAFLNGNYGQTLNLLAAAEKLTPLDARGHFYRACSRAATSLTVPAANAARARQLQDEARRSYRAAASDTAEFRRDLQWVSPGVRQLLGLK
jgi:hypothetical protein